VAPEVLDHLLEVGKSRVDTWNSVSTQNGVEDGFGAQERVTY